MSMKTMYWVSNISSWNYIDISGKTHGRIDWFDDIHDMGYWWQTAHENGICSTVERAKRGVEEALMRRRMALALLYDQLGDAGPGAEGEEAHGDLARPA